MKTLKEKLVKAGFKVEARKYEIKTEKDYEAFLFGKLLQLADEISFETYQEMEKWVKRHESIKEYESQIEKLENSLGEDY